MKKLRKIVAIIVTALTLVFGCFSVGNASAAHMSPDPGGLLITEIHVDTANPNNSFIEMMDFTSYGRTANTETHILVDSVVITYTLGDDQTERQATHTSDPRNTIERTSTPPWTIDLNDTTKYYTMANDYIIFYLPITDRITIKSLEFETANAFAANHANHYNNYELTVLTEEMRDRTMAFTKFSYEIESNLIKLTMKQDKFEYAVFRPIQGSGTPFSSTLSGNSSKGLWASYSQLPIPDAPTTNLDPKNSNIAVYYYGEPRPEPSDEISEPITLVPEPIVPTDDHSQQSIPNVDTSNSISDQNSFGMTYPPTEAESVPTSYKSETPLKSDSDYQIPKAGVIEEEFVEKSFFLPIILILVFLVTFLIFFLIGRRKVAENEHSCYNYPKQ